MSGSKVFVFQGVCNTFARQAQGARVLRMYEGQHNALALERVVRHVRCVAHDDQLGAFGQRAPFVENDGAVTYVGSDSHTCIIARTWESVKSGSVYVSRTLALPSRLRSNSGTSA